MSRYQWTPRVQKTVPEVMNGLRAKPPTTPLEKSVLEWAKNEKLHKYWPIFSHMSYDQLVSMSENNLDDLLQQIGALPVVTGARKCFVKCAKQLRARAAMLDMINVGTMSAPEVAEILLTVLKTPISRTFLEPDGRNLAAIMREKLLVAIAWYGDTGLKFYKFRIMLERFLKNDLLPEVDRLTVAKVLSRQRPRPRHNSCPSMPAYKSSTSSPNDDNLAKIHQRTMTKALLNSSGINSNVCNALEQGPVPGPSGLLSFSGFPASRSLPKSLDFSTFPSLPTPRSFSKRPESSTPPGCPTLQTSQASKFTYAETVSLGLNAAQQQLRKQLYRPSGTHQPTLRQTMTDPADRFPPSINANFHAMPQSYGPPAPSDLFNTQPLTTTGIDYNQRSSGTHQSTLRQTMTDPDHRFPPSIYANFQSMPRPYSPLASLLSLPLIGTAIYWDKSTADDELDDVFADSVSFDDE